MDGRKKLHFNHEGILWSIDILKIAIKIVSFPIQSGTCPWVC